MITLSAIYVHPRYNPKTVDYDIALLKLSRPVKFTKYIRPACVPSSSFKEKAGANAFVSGWGATSEGGSTSAILQVAKVSRTWQNMNMEAIAFAPVFGLIFIAIIPIVSVCSLLTIR